MQDAVKHQLPDSIGVRPCHDSVWSLELSSTQCSSDNAQAHKLLQSMMLSVTGWLADQTQDGPVLSFPRMHPHSSIRDSIESASECGDANLARKKTGVL